MSEQSYVCELKQEHVDQAAKVVTRAFLHLNDIWKKYNPKYQDILPIMRGKIIKTTNIEGMSFVLMHGTQVIGVNLHYDLLDYLTMPSMPSNLQLFNTLSDAGKKLQKKVDISTIKKGEAIYAVFAVTDPDFAKSGLSMKSWWQQLAIGRCLGWKYYYSRISSPISLKMIQKFGAQIVAEVEVQGLKGPQKIWMVRLELKNIPAYTTLKSLSELNKKSKL